MKRRATCFFCYSWDNQDLFDKLSVIKDKLEENNGEITVILDKRNYRYNENFDDSLEKIKKYDIIVPFFTPEFKAIVTGDLLGKKRELVKEYEMIKQRFEEDENSVFPVILEGNRETSIPSDFDRKNCPNIKDWRINVVKDETLLYSKDGEAAIDKFFNDLIGQIKYNFYNKSTEYENARQALDKLFRLTNTTALPSTCLVQIDIYPKIMNQEYYFMAGRKGSGKSTFIHNFKTINPGDFETKYKRIMPIIAENFNHNFVYNNLIKKHDSDRDIISCIDILMIFWKLYFVLHSIFTIGREIEEGRITDVQRKIRFMKIVNKLKELLSLKDLSGKYRSLSGEGVPKQIFMLAAESIDDQYNIAIDRANEKSIYSSFLANMNEMCILEVMFERELLDEFINELGRCTKKIIIALDGFDTFIEDFRRVTLQLSKGSDEYRARSDYERSFYRTLIEVVTQFKSNAFSDSLFSTLQEYLDFCIVLPKDRYDQIISMDRDSAKKKFCSLDWDAYELMELIVRRLEYLVQKIDENAIINKNRNMFERFDSVIDFFPLIPKTITINIDGHNMQMSLFNYLLRSSFWRPRDIISNFSSILAYVIKNESSDNISVIKSGEIIDNEMLKITIKNNARTIIQKELIAEYENTFINLNSILRGFMDYDLITNAEMFCHQLSKMRFEASFAYNLDKVSDKLYVLYQLGIIGLYFDKKTAKSLGYLHHICFLFNAGLEPIRAFTEKEDYENAKAKIIFNPIFSEKCALNINTNELLCNWDKEYIDTLHKMKSFIYTM